LRSGGSPPLPETFREGDFEFRQVAREGDVALYEKRKPSISNLLYEVVIVQEMEAHTWPDGRVSPAHEHLPGSWQWGSAGWFYSDLDDAWAKFRELSGGQVRSPFPMGEIPSPVERLRLREAL
jgi:hypothetical protein